MTWICCSWQRTNWFSCRSVYQFHKLTTSLPHYKPHWHQQNSIFCTQNCMGNSKDVVNISFWSGIIYNIRRNVCIKMLHGYLTHRLNFGAVKPMGILYPVVPTCTKTDRLNGYQKNMKWTPARVNKTPKWFHQGRRSHNNRWHWRNALLGSDRAHRRQQNKHKRR